MPPLILASTSRYRRALLERLGVPFTAERPDCDEAAVQADRSLTPQQVAETLADRKAQSVARQHPAAVVIGSDQLGALGRRILGKAHTRDAACAQLADMQGRTHELITAVTVAVPQAPPLRHTAIIRLTMRPLDATQIARYVDADQPLDCAGSYKLEQRGITLFERIDGDDHTAIIGLPLLWLTATLVRLGYPV